MMFAIDLQWSFIPLEVFMLRTKKLSLLTLVSAMAFVGCGGNSGGRSNNNQLIPGVGQMNVFPNETCSIQNSYYSCSQTVNGTVYRTNQNSFTSIQDLCMKISDNNSNANRDLTTGQIVAQQTRQDYSMRNCQNQPGTFPNNPLNPTNPTFPGNNNNFGIKNISCQMQVRKGESNISTIGEVNLPVAANGGYQYLTAKGVVNKNVWRVINVSHMATLARVKVEYMPSMSIGQGGLSQIKLSASDVDGDISVATVGYAGAENRLEIIPQNSEDNTEVIVSCIMRGEALPAAAVVATKLQCIGSEKINGQMNKINYVNQLSDVLTSGISLTRSIFVQGQSNMTGGLSDITYSQQNRSDSQINFKANMGVGTSVSIQKAGYSMNVKCSPK